MLLFDSILTTKQGRQRPLTILNREHLSSVSDSWISCGMRAGGKPSNCDSLGSTADSSVLCPLSPVDRSSPAPMKQVHEARLMLNLPFLSLCLVRQVQAHQLIPAYQDIINVEPAAEPKEAKFPTTCC